MVIMTTFTDVHHELSLAQTFEVKIDKSCVILHVVGDFTLIAAVVLQRDVVDDDGGVTWSCLLRFHTPAVEPERPLQPAQCYEHIHKLELVRHLGPFDADAFRIHVLRLMVVAAR